MQAEAALGLRKAVIGRYEKLSEILEEQLGLQPHVETRRLYRQLLGQDHEQDPLPAARAMNAARNAKSREPEGPRDLTQLTLSRGGGGCQAGTATAAEASSPLSRACSMRRAISSIVPVRSWIRSTACSGFQPAR